MMYALPTGTPKRGAMFVSVVVTASSRSARMVAKYFDGVLPAPEGPLDDVDRELRDVCAKVVADYAAKMDALEMHGAFISVWTLISALNKYIDKTAPWELAKSNRPRLSTVMYHAMEALRFVAVLVSPVMPGASRKRFRRGGGSPSHTSPMIDLTRSSRGLPDSAGKFAATEPGL